MKPKARTRKAERRKGGQTGCPTLRVRAFVLLTLSSLVFGVIGSSGCTGTPLPPGSGTTGSQAVAQQLTQAQAAQGVRVSFRYSDYYSLSNPNSEGCAGDVRTLYDPLALITPSGPTAGGGYEGTLGVTGPTGPWRFH